MKDFEGKVAVVTGAASGIGRGMAENFIEAGMKVVLADIEEDRLQTTVKTFKDAGADVLGIPMDVSKAEQVKALADKTIETYGAVHVLCNNAGVGYGGRSSWQTPLEGWDWVIGVNLMGVIYGAHYFLPIMLKQDTEAHIVNTSSVAGLITNTFSIPYGVSKHGVVALTESMHIELMLRGAKIKVSVLCPGPVSTDIMDSSQRNRPSNVPPPPEPTKDESVFMEAYRTWIERGLDPKAVGKQVLDAIKEERLYLTTAPELDKYIDHRMKNVTEKKNPVPTEPVKSLMDILEEVRSKS